jgi:A/G-specific adenine glycosylase
MEFGNVICKPKSPLCGQCSIREYCPTFADGLQHEIPARTRNTNYETVEEAIVIVRRRGKLLVRQCGEDERWSGLWDFPRYVINGSRPIEFLQHSLAKQFGLSTRIHSLDKTIRHSVTRFRIILRCFGTSKVEGRLNAKSTPTRWATRREIDVLPMSMTGRKIAQQLDEFGSR